MAHKPCELVLIKRYPQDETLRLAYEPDYYVAHFRPIGEGNYDWVKFQSNATLFNKRDARRDLLPHLSSVAQHQIIVNHHCIPSTFELVEFIERKHFGWVIYRVSGEGEQQYLSDVWPDAFPPHEQYRWVSSEHTATILDTDSKNAELAKLRERYPALKFEAQELFTQ